MSEYNPNANANANAGAKNGERPSAAPGADAPSSAGKAKEHLRAARDAAADAVRGTTQQARGWSRAQLNTLQERVEAEPYRATAWALGIGFIAGVLITALARGSRR